MVVCVYFIKYSLTAFLDDPDLAIAFPISVGITPNSFAAY